MTWMNRIRSALPRPRFSLRQLFMAFTLLGVGFACAAYATIRIHRLNKIAQGLEGHGHTVVYGDCKIIGVKIKWNWIPNWLLFLVPESAFADITYVGMFGDSDIADGIENLRHLDKLEQLEFTTTSLSSRDIKCISRLSSIQVLRLTYTRIPDKSWNELSRLPELEELYLIGDEISDETLRGVSQLNKLGTFSLVSSAEVTDSSAEELVKLPQIQRIVIEYCDNITDRGMARIGESRTIEALELRRVPITDVSCLHISTLSRLQRLRMDQCAISDQGASILARNMQLRVVTLAGTQITDFGVEELSKLSSLESLSVARTRHTDKSTVALRRLSLLKRLTLGPDVTTQAATSLKSHIPDCEIVIVDAQGDVALRLP